MTMGITASRGKRGEYSGRRGCGEGEGGSVKVVKFVKLVQFVKFVGVMGALRVRGAGWRGGGAGAQKVCAGAQVFLRRCANWLLEGGTREMSVCKGLGRLHMERRRDAQTFLQCAALGGEYCPELRFYVNLGKDEVAWSPALLFGF